MAFVFPPHLPAALPVAGGADSFPVRRVYCVGRNYADHAREMGAADQATGSAAGRCGGKTKAMATHPVEVKLVASVQ
jgi:hypothetical protein